MLQLKYKLEASNYFFDNGDLTRELQIAVEDLVFTNGKPTKGEYYEFPRNMYVWLVYNHVVIYSIKDNRLIVRVVKPLN